MSELEFTIDLSAPKKQLMDIITDYERYTTYLPDQLRSIKIIEKNDNVVITEESILFSNYIKKPFQQRTKHVMKNSDMHQSTLISGPAEGSIVNISLKNIDSDSTQVYVKIELKLSWKAKFLLPLIKKWYKRVIRSLLYNMNNLAEEKLEKNA